MDKTYRNPQKRLDETEKLSDDGHNLANALWTEYERDYEDDTYHDWDFLYWRVLRSSLQPLGIAMTTENNIGYLNQIIQKGVADEKIRFESEKAYRDHLRYMILPHLENLIDIAKTMKFNDYRVQRFQLRLGEVMQKLKDAYDQILGDDQEANS